MEATGVTESTRGGGALSLLAVVEDMVRMQKDDEFGRMFFALLADSRVKAATFVLEKTRDKGRRGATTLTLISSIVAKMQRNKSTAASEKRKVEAVSERD